MTYIDGPKEAGCIFCYKGRGEDLRSSLVLAQTPHSLVLLNKYPYSNGHLLLAPKRHTNELSSLLSDEYWDLCRAFKGAVDNLSRALKPGGFNLAPEQHNSSATFCQRDRSSSPNVSGRSSNQYCLLVRHFDNLHCNNMKCNCCELSSVASYPSFEI